MRKVGYYIILLLLFEFVCFLLVNVIHLAPPMSGYKRSLQPFFLDNNEVFGAWHLNNTKTKSVGDRWNVTYARNSYEARDKQREKASDKPRVLCLGDSFVEGFGVEADERFSNLIEQKQATERVNFGTSGNVGTTQFRLIYESLAKQFTHDVLVVTLLPSNDFYDDDYEFSKDFFYTKNRYRPYLIKDSSALEKPQIFYHVSDIEESEYHYSKIQTISYLSGLQQLAPTDSLGVGVRLKTAFVDYTHMGTVLGFIVKRFKQQIADYKYQQQNSTQSPQEAYRSFFAEPDEAYLNTTLYNCSKIKEQLGPDKRMFLVLIPAPYDILAYQDKPVNELSPLMKDFCRQQGITLIDLMQVFGNNKDYLDYFLSCDGHWNAKGYQLVSEEIINNMRAEGVF